MSMILKARSRPSSSAQPSARVLGIGFAAAGAALMSLDPVFVRYSGVSGFNTAFLFGLFTAISLPVAIQASDKRGLKQTLVESGWPLVVSGLLMVVSASSLILSIKNTSVANTFVILSAQPALAALFSRLFLGEVTKRSTWLAIGGVAAGILILVSGPTTGSASLGGDVLAAVAATALALNQTLLRRFPDVSRMGSVGAGGLFLALVMFPLADPTSFEASTWLVMAAMGLFTAPFGRVMAQTATRHITAPEVGLVLMFETVLAPLWAYSFFSEVPPAATVIGGTIILGTLITYTLTTINAADAERDPS